MTQFMRPQSLDEAVHALRDYEPRPVLVAGCTDLMVVDHALGRSHGCVMDVLNIPELRGVVRAKNANGVPCLDIGAAETFSSLRKEPLVTACVPIISEMAATIGAWQIQNRATVGGNIANASPAGDSLPVWLALDADCVVASARGVRLIPYRALHLGYRKTALEADEILVRVQVPIPPASAVQFFKKVGTRQAQAISKVAVAFSATIDQGALCDVRIAAGSVAATPVRLFKTETLLEGAVAEHSSANAAELVARDETTPIDDVRSTAEYRRLVLGRVIRRMVLQAGSHGA